MNKKLKTFYAVWLILIVAACEPVASEISTPDDLTTSTSVPVSTKVPDVIPSLIATARATLTETPPAEAFDFKDIKQGQYILVGDLETEEPYLHIISTDGQIVKSSSLQSYLELYTFTGATILNAHFDLSSDGTQLLILRPSPKFSYLYNISTDEQTSFSIKQTCHSASWSPDKKFIALTCETDNSIEIFVLDTVSKQISQVTECHNIYKHCEKVSWSTNGHWLAYYQRDDRSGEHPRGIMIFNTSCFDRNNCMNEQMGPFEADSNPVWTLDNQLVYMQSGMISYIELKNRRPNQVQAYRVPELNYFGRSSETIEFSPDGQYLACLAINQEGVYLYSPQLNESKLIFSNQGFRSLDIIGWVTIK